MSARDFANECLDFVNGGYNKQEFTDTMLTGHRTLQQSFMRLIMNWLKALSEQEYYDGRNEASVKLAKRIMDAVGDDYCLPYI